MCWGTKPVGTLSVPTGAPVAYTPERHPWTVNSVTVHRLEQPAATPVSGPSRRGRSKRGATSCSSRRGRSGADDGAEDGAPGGAPYGAPDGAPDTASQRTLGKHQRCLMSKTSWKQNFVQKDGGRDKKKKEVAPGKTLFFKSPQ